MTAGMMRTGAVAAPPMREQFGFDPTHGMGLKALLAVRAPEHEPLDLDTFWAGVAGEAADLALDLRLGRWRALESGADVQVADVGYRSLDGIRIGGWLTRPRGTVTRGVVVGHGYGGRDAADLADIPKDAVALFPVARGLPARSEVDGVGGETGMHHVLWGIRSPRGYSHVGSAVDMWLAARVLRELFPLIGRVDYLGSSFGGGIGALALGFGDCFDAGVLEVPSFGHHAWRVAVPSTGSAQIVGRYVLEHPEAMRTLGYVDAASAARRVRVPVLVLTALADPSVPPPGQFAVANALGGPTRVHVPAHGHCAGGDGCDDPLRSATIGAFLQSLPVRPQHTPAGPADQTSLTAAEGANHA
ncbi:acetylxylan esterase [Humibacter antri]